MLVQWHLEELNTNTKLQPSTAPCTVLALIEETQNCLEITIILQLTRTDESYPDPTVLDNTMSLKSETFCAHAACLVCRGFLWELPNFKQTNHMFEKLCASS